MKQKIKTRTIFAGLLGFSLAINLGAKQANKQDKLSTGPTEAAGPLGTLESSTEGRALRQAWIKANYQFTPAVKSAYITYAKAETKKQLQAANKTLPADFLTWVDSDPVVQETVYGARIDPTNVLLVLRSLEIDLGKDVVRKQYTQLALAMAVVHAKDATQPDISPRPLYKLVIPTCPLKPVDTKDPNRTLDENDFIINFLNENFIEDTPTDRKWTQQASKLAYDGRGTAVAGSTAKPDSISPKEKRSLTAADVMASADLQKQFNAYMTAHGQTVQIDCGDHVLFPDRHDEVKGAEAKPILDAFHLFKTAYEAKGLLPAERDPAPTAAASCAFLIRNHEDKTTGVALTGKKKLPDCPLTAPWPVMTLLAADTQPLREREDIWERYHNRGELHTYGEYIGGIAQQFDFQSARRLAPYPYSYGTFQMMLKDGGVCGTMANIQVRSLESLGVPACTAGQPGHCALIYFATDPKVSNAYECMGAQFVTGGPDDTHPHTPFVFGDTDEKRDMVYYQSIAYAVNEGLASYLDSTIAYDVYRVLSTADRTAHGETLLASGLAINPFNFLLADAAVADAATASTELDVEKSLKTDLASQATKPGCPADSLYSQTVQDRVYASIAKLPVPASKTEATAIYTALQQSKCDNADALAVYQSATQGLATLLSRTETDFKTHLTSIRTEASCETMAAELAAAAKAISDKAQKSQWVLSRWNQIQGHEAYFGKNSKITTDLSATTLARLAVKKLPDEAALTKPLIDQTTVALKTELAGDRDMKTCRLISGQITAVARQTPDAQQIKPWLESLSQLMTGHEEFTPKNARKNAKPVRDPCADTIAQLLSPAAAVKE